MSLDQIGDSFAASAEFRGLTSGMNNAQIVDFLYRTVLDRPPEPGAVDYWVWRLNTGMDQGDLLISFSQSQEHFQLLSSSIVGGIELFGP